VHAKVHLMESSFTPGDPFPIENHLKECKLGNFANSDVYTYDMYN